MEITGDNLISLMFVSMTDNRMIEAIDSLGLEQPVIDEQYEVDLNVTIRDKENSGVTLVFKEINPLAKDGELFLSEINLSHDDIITSPFGLSFNDSYENCSRKLTKIANYNHTWVDELKIWVMECGTNKCSLSIQFKDKDLNCIKAIVFIPFDEQKVGDIYEDNTD